MHSEPFAWVEPLRAAGIAASRETCWTFLFSGQRPEHTGRFSYLCLMPQEEISSGGFAALSAKLTSDRPALANAWFGYLGYELLHENEVLPRQAARLSELPELFFVRFGIILQFDHDTRTVTCHREPSLAPPLWLLADAPSSPAGAHVKELTSPMKRAQYLQAVNDTREAILRGDFYQANITRKFNGSFTDAPDAFSVFLKLCEASPATYSAFMRMGERAILSSSPERFLTITPDGHVETRPIKGTAPRLADAAADNAQRVALEKSEKDRAENLMIVDLMRNDLAKACETGSVQVDKLFEVTSYATLHHLASVVSGRKRSDVSALAAVKYCFPPGSMTGAPKIRAMQWCLEQERIQRGVYSGALGWFGGDGSCDLSVVIRTLIIEGNRFEFEVGGGIVADSEAESEWRETLTKARGILAALGIDAKKLEEI